MKKAIHMLLSMIKYIAKAVLFLLQMIMTLFCVVMRLVLSLIKIAEN